MKHILITGVSSGIGYATTEYLLGRGYFVFGSVRSEADAIRLKEVFATHFHPLIFDVTDDKAVRGAYTEVAKIVGDKGLYGLINNAGIAVSGPLKYLPLNRISHQMEVNVIGLLRVTQVFLPLLGGEMDTDLKPGRLINISSISGLIANPLMGAYCASKFAVEALTDALRRELSIYDIKVVAIEPGVIKTNIYNKAKRESVDYEAPDYEDVLAKRPEIIKQIEKGAIPAVRVAEAVEKALIVKNPKTRYIVTKKKWKVKFFAYVLPDKLQDYVIDRSFRKNFNIRGI
jgi:short-subunit dehydrogenase